MAGRDFKSILSPSEFEEASNYEKYIRTTMKDIAGLFSDKETAKRVENTLIEYKWNYLTTISLRKQHEAKRQVCLELLKKYRNAPTDAEAKKHLKKYNSCKQELDALAKEYSHYETIVIKLQSEASKCDTLFDEKRRKAEANKSNDFKASMNRYGKK